MLRRLLVGLIVTAAIVCLTGCPKEGSEQGSGEHKSPNIGTLKYVPAGSFQRDDEAENMSIIGEPFLMAEHQITQAQFEAIMGTNPSLPGCGIGDDHPVNKATWYDAITFANKLSIAEGLTPVYSVHGVDFDAVKYSDIPTRENADWNAVAAEWDADGYRLPTEMEWMWAAMGADQDSFGDPMQDGVNISGYDKPFAGYDGSNSIGDCAWYGGNSYSDSNTDSTTGSTCYPVGSKLPNELGLYDMSGNVFEWNWDWYEDDGSFAGAGYAISGTIEDYTGAATGSRRVRRGGSWSYNSSNCAVASRNNSDPQRGDVDCGFRLVRRADSI